jgi:hypothetical protein
MLGKCQGVKFKELAAGPGAAAPAALKLYVRRAAEHSETQSLHRAGGNPRLVATALGNLASVHQENGRNDLAGAYGTEALALHRKVRNRHGEALLLCDFARFEVLVGQTDEAREAWQQGTALLRESDDLQRLAEKTRLMRDACAEAGVEAFGGESGG